MTKTKTISISGPFDVRHVSGVGLPGATVPPHGVQRSFSETLEPDEAPTHLNMSTKPAAPRRSNTIAHSLNRPTLRLKTSLSLLRGRSSSSSPDSHRRKDHDHISEPAAAPPAAPVAPSRSTYVRTTVTGPSAARPSTPTPARASTPALKRQMSLQTLPYADKKLPTRPQRADSGTAIDFADVPAEERPLGFKEIMAVKSHAERMALYKRTREYWACVDHGLDNWVGRAGLRKPLVSMA